MKTVTPDKGRRVAGKKGRFLAAMERVEGIQAAARLRVDDKIAGQLCQEYLTIADDMGTPLIIYHNDKGRFIYFGNYRTKISSPLFNCLTADPKLDRIQFPLKILTLIFEIGGSIICCSNVKSLYIYKPPIFRAKTGRT